MTFLNNLKLIWKIILAIGLLAGVSALSIGFVAYRMIAIDGSYSRLVNNVDLSTLDAARSGLNIQDYMAAGYQLLFETTEDRKSALRKRAAEQKAVFLTRYREATELLPQKRVEFDAVLNTLVTVFTACDPLLDQAAALTTPSETVRIVDSFKAKCIPPSEIAFVDLRTFVIGLVSDASRSATTTSEHTMSTIRMAVASVAGVLLVSLAIGIWIGIKGISQPIARLMGAMARLASDDFSCDVPGTMRHDELGGMARTVEVFKKNGLEVKRLREEQRELEELVAARRKRNIEKFANDFESAVGEIINTVSSASTELEASATSLTTVADRSKRIAVVVASASKDASTNVQSVASATDELAATVHEISRQVQESARIASGAVDQVRATNERVSELTDAAGSIGAVVGLIATIASQTNLLALNATIEAARAGDAGRGFAVVAAEVKALAEQTTKATAEINKKVTGIQTATGQSVIDIQEIGATISSVSEIASAIAAAVEQQGAATQEIARNVQQAALLTVQVGSNVVDLQLGTSETGSASTEVLSAAQSLSRDSNRLKSEVDRFLIMIREA